MATANKSGVPTIAKTKNEGERVAKKAAYSPLMDRLTRLGYGIKGLIYMTIGILSLGAVLGKNSSPADQVGAIREIGKLPLGELVLWVVLIGLISYSLWGIIRAVLDPYHKGTDTSALLERGGYLVSAVTYASFVLPTYQLIRNSGSGSSSSQTGQIISKIMALPFGREFVGALGVVIILGGAYQIYAGAKQEFRSALQALRVERGTEESRHAARPLWNHSPRSGICSHRDVCAAGRLASSPRDGTRPGWCTALAGAAALRHVVAGNHCLRTDLIRGLFPDGCGLVQAKRSAG